MVVTIIIDMSIWCKMKKVLLVIAVIAVIALFVVTNTLWKGFFGDYELWDEHDWTDLSYEVIRGDGEEFSAELVGPQRFKVKYTGDYDLEAILTFKDGKETGKYQFILHEKSDPTNDGMYVDSELIEIEQ